MKVVLKGEKMNTSYAAVELGEIKYEFALEYFDLGSRNTWFPREIPLAEDVHQWNTVLTDMEKHYVTWMLGFFCTSESLVANNLIMGLYPFLPVPEIRLYLARQAYEEMNHVISMNYVIKTLDLDREAIFKMHSNVPEMKAKEDFETLLTHRLLTTKYDENSGSLMVQNIIKNLIGYYVVLEGIFFFSGFLVGLSFERRRLLKGFGALIRYILKDETIHLAFGADLIAAMIKENPEVMSSKFKEEIIQMVKTAVELEEQYAKAAMPEGILGLNKDIFGKYVRHIADRRLQQIGFKKIYGDRNPAKWLAAQNDVPELINFFEAKPIDYENSIGD